MHGQDRRRFLKLLGAGSLAMSALPDSIQRAMAIPADRRTGTIKDVEHIVILMQENRSFDHFLGSLSGVRGFGDPRVARLGNGKPVWYQPELLGGYVLPFRPDAPDLGLVFIQDLAHDWDSTHAAWNNGNWDQWVLAKGTTTMAHLSRQDIPFHYALADAFTVCDAYHCSLLGPTDPNRYHLFTGWVGNDGTGGGPVLDNTEAGYSWTTFPERLQAAGISWKVYQDTGLGLTKSESWGSTSDAYIGNYGDNPLLYFHQYQNAPDGSPLAQRARTGTHVQSGGTLFDDFKSDIAAGRLPAVSWIVAPEAYCEHPNWPANYGAYYVSQMLDALTADPEVWSRTALFITYDENDGFFDHVVAPTPPVSRAQGLSTVSTKNEIITGRLGFLDGPIGLGVRVPMFVVSPWSRGGYVNSQVFDHTSLIRFIEARFADEHPALIETNITEWRRAVSGDLTSAFNFADPDTAPTPRLPSTAGYIPPDDQRHPDYVPVVPLRQALPKQEKGVRPARALPYDLEVVGDVLPNDQLAARFVNSGRAAAVFQVRADNGLLPPLTYTVGAGETLADTWQFGLLGLLGGYAASIYGPNGFYRHLAGGFGPSAANVQVLGKALARSLTFAFTLINQGSAAVRVRIRDNYRATGDVVTLQPGKQATFTLDTTAYSGWYDIVITAPDADPAFIRQLSGHIENGRDSITDPAIAQPPRQA